MQKMREEQIAQEKMNRQIAQRNEGCASKTSEEHSKAGERHMQRQAAAVEQAFLSSHGVIAKRTANLLERTAEQQGNARQVTARTGRQKLNSNTTRAEAGPGLRPFRIKLHKMLCKGRLRLETYTEASDASLVLGLVDCTFCLRPSLCCGAFFNFCTVGHMHKASSVRSMPLLLASTCCCIRCDDMRCVLGQSSPEARASFTAFRLSRRQILFLVDCL